MALKFSFKLSCQGADKLLFKCHRLLLILILFVLVILAVFIYYRYIYLVIQTEVNPTIEKVTIDQSILDKVLNNLDMRQENWQRVKNSSYQDPFNL